MDRSFGGKKVIVRIGPFGPMAQIGEKEDNENAQKPKFASLLKKSKNTDNYIKKLLIYLSYLELSENGKVKRLLLL